MCVCVCVINGTSYKEKMCPDKLDSTQVHMYIHVQYTDVCTCMYSIQMYVHARTVYICTCMYSIQMYMHVQYTDVHTCTCMLASCIVCVYVANRENTSC